MTTSERITMSVPEAAAELGCSERYMYELMRRDDCTYGLRLGRRLRVVRSEFERWILNQTAESEKNKVPGRIC